MFVLSYCILLAGHLLLFISILYSIDVSSYKSCDVCMIHTCKRQARISKCPDLLPRGIGLCRMSVRSNSELSGEYIDLMLFQMVGNLSTSI